MKDHHKTNLKLQIGRLLITPPPYPDENLRGYVVRLAESNGYDPPHVFYKALVGAIFDTQRPEKFYSFLETNRYRQLCPVTGVQAEVFNQIEARRRVINKWAKVRCLKYCAACLQEKPYYRLLWNHEFYCVCHMHKTILIDTCPGCENLIDWENNKICQCRCSYDLRNSSALPAHPEAILISQRIATLSGLREATNNAPLQDKRATLKKFCDVLSLMVGLRSDLLNVGRLCENDRNPKYHEVITTSFKLLQDWPHSFNHLITDLIEADPQKVLHCLDRYRSNSISDIALVIWEWRTFIKNKWPEQKSLKKKTAKVVIYNRDAQGGKRFNHGNPLAHHIRVSEEWIRQKLAEANFPVPYVQRSENLYEINAPALQGYLNEFAIPYSVEVINKQFQIPQNLILKLVASGLFEIPCFFEVKSKSEPRFDILPINALFSEIQRHARKGLPSDEVKGVTLSEAIELISRYFLCPIRFIDDIRKGRIRPFIDDQQSISKGTLFYFSLSELSAYANSLGHNVTFGNDKNHFLQQLQPPPNSDNSIAEVQQTWVRRAALFLEKRQKIHRVHRNLDYENFMQVAMRIFGSSCKKNSLSGIPKNLRVLKNNEAEFSEDVEQIFLDSMCDQSRLP